MLIKKINVTNFGKLSDFSLELNPGLNVIYAPNESGKTTLLSFIKYIFYGTKQRKNAGDLSFKERYTPWNGMSIGGSVEFLDKNKFLIQRVEHKNPGRLSVLNLDNGQPRDDIISPGMHFIGMSEKAFSDTCFVTDIMSLVGGLSDSELISCFSASNKADETYSKIKSELDNRLANLISLKRKSSSLSIIEYGLHKNTERINILNKSIEETEEKLREISRFEDELNNIKSRNNMLISKKRESIIESLQDELDGLRKRKSQLADNTTIHLDTISKWRFGKSFYMNLIYLLLSVFCAAGLFVSLYFIIPFVFFALVWIYSLKNKLSQDKNKSDDSNIINNQLEYIESREIYIRNILDNSEDALNSGINYINFFTNSSVDDIIVSNENKIKELTSLINQNLHYKDKLFTQKSELVHLNADNDKLTREKTECLNEARLVKRALAILDSSYEKAKEAFFPHVLSETCSIFSEITDSSADFIVTDDKFSLRVSDGGIVHSAKYLSSGTLDVLYFCLRIAIIDTISPEDNPLPIFLDDIFSDCDDKRCVRLMNVLYRMSKNRQIILCTCRGREGEFFELKKDVNIIKL